MIPRKILAICDDCIVLGSLSNYGSQHLTHPSEVLVDIEQLYQLFDRTGECSELIDAITK